MKIYYLVSPGLYYVQIDKVIQPNKKYKKFRKLYPFDIYMLVEEQHKIPIFKEDHVIANWYNPGIEIVTRIQSIIIQEEFILYTPNGIHLKKRHDNERERDIITNTIKSYHRIKTKEELQRLLIIK